MKIDKNKLLKYKSVIGLLAFSIIISFVSPQFLTFSNILNVFRQTSINSIIAAGMTFVILTGGIDLSVGSVLAFAGAICASLIASGMNAFFAIAIALMVGTLAGAISGIIISRGKVQPFIATLVSMTVLRGATLVFTDGRPITLVSGENAERFSTIGNGYFLGIPVPIYITLIVFVAAYYILRQTRLGRYVYALGGNEEATKLSGISVAKIKVIVYALSGLCAALAGVIITSRLASAQPNAGSGYELDAIAAVVLGGTSLSGGMGSIFGTVTGALIIGVLNNALNILNVSSYYQMIVKGAVILIAVLLDRKK
ncbi:ribose ABC transporter permease [Anaerosolibacter sp.]|jgi:ribose transport system permease protein|uniref:ribose ABC transporter permease n=1 Tax=Anaerosolibacter sp. TaxID=1872527 RepID=UPI002608D69C|nr:ribose ABC transporter permease [Anaerosolibacter sp.]MDF2547839.1 rbsC [Anaerosolibacter sp.]